MNRHLAVKVYASAAIFGAIAIFAAGATLTFHFVKPHAQASAWALTGVYVNCSDNMQPGVPAIANYLQSLGKASN